MAESRRVTIGRGSGTIDGETARNVRRPLRALVAAAGTSSLGDGLLVTAFPLLAVSVTRSPVLVAGLAVAAGLPWLLVGLPAGALVDRLDKRRLVVVVELARAVVLALVAATVLTGHIELSLLYAAAFAIGVGETFVAAVRRAVVPRLVAQEGLPGANGYIFAAEVAGERFAGPALGGWLFELGRSLPFVGDAASFLASALLMRRVLPAAPRASAQPGPPFGRTLREGLRWFFATAALRRLVVVVATFALCQAMVLAVLVLFATRSLHLHAGGYGLMLGVAAVGDVVAGVGAGRIHRRLGTFATVGSAGLVAGGAYLLLGLTTRVDVTVVALVAEAGAATLGNVATLSVRQRLIPAERFGLINNTFRLFVAGAVPLGALVGGLMAEAAGLRATFLLAGSLQIVVLGVLAGRLRPLMADGTGGGEVATD